MALWKDPTKQSPSPPPEAMSSPRFDTPSVAEHKLDVAVPSASMHTSARERAKTESLIAPDITIEGKIEGSGHVRIAGRFKGDVNVQGDLSIESGAQVTGSIRADKVLIAGELVGNIESASHVELVQSGALTGDLKAATLTVAAGSRMRGQVEFGWDDAKTLKGTKKNADNSNGLDHGTAS